MARARAEPATGPAETPRRPTATLGLTVDGGTPPQPKKKRVTRKGDPAVAPQPGPVVGTADTELEPVRWSEETVTVLVSIPFMVAHGFARRRGPADAWKPDRAELDLMVAPLVSMANRYTVLRALARFGDPIAFVSATGAYVGGESHRIDRWRATHEPAVPPPPPDADLAGLGTAATAPGEPPRRDTGSPIVVEGVRPWRPPMLPTEQP